MLSQFIPGTRVGMYGKDGYITDGHITGIDENGTIQIITDDSWYSFTAFGLCSYSGRYIIPLYPHQTTVKVSGVVMVRIDGEWITNLTVEGKRLIFKELPAGEEITVLYHP